MKWDGISSAASRRVSIESLRLTLVTGCPNSLGPLFRDADLHRLDRCVSGLAEGSGHRLGVSLFIDGSTTKGVFSCGETREDDRPMSIGQTQRPFQRSPRGIETVCLFRDFPLAQCRPRQRWLEQFCVDPFRLSKIRLRGGLGGGV